MDEESETSTDSTGDTGSKTGEYTSDPGRNHGPWAMTPYGSGTVSSNLDPVSSFLRPL